MENIHFYFYKVTKNFNPSSVFSRVELCLDRYTTASNQAYAVIKVKNLYNLDRVEITEENKDVIKFIKNCKQIAWPPYCSERITEHIALTEISQKIFRPLCCPGQVILDNTYTKHLRTLGPAAGGLKALPIGCGSNKTWHGSPDARVRGTEIINEYVTGEEDENADLDANSFDGATTKDCNLDGNNSDESDGTMTTIEANIKYNKNSLQQAVATCVVSSFIEHTLHRTLPSIVPTILIDLRRFRVCFYDCTEDLLLVSTPIQLQSSNKSRLSRSAVLLLWLTFNHR